MVADLHDKTLISAVRTEFMMYNVTDNILDENDKVMALLAMK